MICSSYSPAKLNKVAVTVAVVGSGYQLSNSKGSQGVSLELYSVGPVQSGCSNCYSSCTTRRYLNCICGLYCVQCSQSEFVLFLELYL